MGADGASLLRVWEHSIPRVTDSVSIRNLRAAVNAGVDAWGRKKPQPCQVSISIALQKPLDAAAINDSVDDSTVHYGILSKRMLAAIEEGNATWATAFELTHKMTEVAANMIEFSSCDVTVCFPKASMHGDGVVVSEKVSGNTWGSTILTRVVQLKDVKVATIIGVNSNERDMRQDVVANVWIDGCSREVGDRYHEAEHIIVKTIEESSYETLESLAMKIISNVTKYFVLPLSAGSNIRLRLEKPSAVPLADAPAIELYRSSSFEDPFGKRMLDELGWKLHRIPYPLQGRLDDHETSLKASAMLGFRMSIIDA